MSNTNKTFALTKDEAKTKYMNALVKFREALEEYREAKDLYEFAKKDLESWGLV